MFSLDTNMDFLFSSGTFSFTNPTEDLAIPRPRDYPIVDYTPTTQYAMNHSVISSLTVPLEASELEIGKGNVADSACTTSSSWTTIEQHNTQPTSHVSRYLATHDGMKLEWELRKHAP